jgi:AraC-like DNA-binding protein
MVFSDNQAIVLHGPMSAGTVHLARPEQQIWVSSTGPCDLIHFSVLKSVLESEFVLAGCGPRHRLNNPGRLVLHDPLTRQIRRFLSESPAGWSTPCVETLGQLVIAGFLQLLPRRASRTPLPLWRLRKVKALVEQDLTAPLRLEDLARAAGLSRMHFAAQFRAATGLRPHEYVLTRRIEHAKHLIERNELSLVEIALDAGFQSQAHFCTIFKRLTGATPTTWRRVRPVCELVSDQAPVICYDRTGAPRRFEPEYGRPTEHPRMNASPVRVQAWPNERVSAHAAQG